MLRRGTGRKHRWAFHKLLSACCSARCPLITDEMVGFGGVFGVFVWSRSWIDSLRTSCQCQSSASWTSSDSHTLRLISGKLSATLWVLTQRGCRFQVICGTNDWKFVCEIKNRKVSEATHSKKKLIKNNPILLGTDSYSRSLFPPLQSYSLEVLLMIRHILQFSHHSPPPLFIHLYFLISCELTQNSTSICRLLLFYMHVCSID